MLVQVTEEFAERFKPAVPVGFKLQAVERRKKVVCIPVKQFKLLELNHMYYRVDTCGLVNVCTDYLEPC